MYQFSRYKNVFLAPSLQSEAGTIPNVEKKLAAALDTLQGVDNNKKAPILMQQQQQQEIEEDVKPPVVASVSTPPVKSLEEFINQTPAEWDAFIATRRATALAALQKTREKKAFFSDVATNPKSMERMKDVLRRAEAVSSALFEPFSWYEHVPEKNDYRVRLATKAARKEIEMAMDSVLEHIPEGKMRNDWQADTLKKLNRWYEGQTEWDDAALLVHIISDKTTHEARQALYRKTFGDPKDTIYIEEVSGVLFEAYKTLLQVTAKVTLPMMALQEAFYAVRLVVGLDFLTPSDRGEEKSDAAAASTLTLEEIAERMVNARIENHVLALNSPLGIYDSYVLPAEIQTATLNVRERIELAASLQADLAVQVVCANLNAEDKVDKLGTFFRNAAKKNHNAKTPAEKSSAPAPHSQGFTSAFQQDRFGDDAEDADAEKKQKDEDELYRKIRQAMLDGLGTTKKDREQAARLPNYGNGLLSAIWSELLERDENSLAYQAARAIEKKCQEGLAEIARQQAGNNPDLEYESKDARVYVGEIDIVSKEMGNLIDASIAQTHELVNQSAQSLNPTGANEAENRTLAITQRSLDMIARIAHKDAVDVEVRYDGEMRKSITDLLEERAEARRISLARTLATKSPSAGGNNSGSFWERAVDKIGSLWGIKRKHAEADLDSDTSTRAAKRQNTSSQGALHQLTALLPVQSRGRVIGKKSADMPASDINPIKAQKANHRTSAAPKNVKVPVPTEPVVTDSMDVDGETNNNHDSDDDDDDVVTDREEVMGHEAAYSLIAAGSVIVLIAVAATAFYMGYADGAKATSAAFGVLSGLDTSLDKAEGEYAQALATLETTEADLLALSDHIDALIKKPDFASKEKNQISEIKKLLDNIQGMKTEIASMKTDSKEAFDKMRFKYIATVKMEELSRTLERVFKGATTASDIVALKTEYAMTYEFLSQEIDTKMKTCRQMPASVGVALYNRAILETAQNAANAFIGPEKSPELTPGEILAGTIGSTSQTAIQKDIAVAIATQAKMETMTDSFFLGAPNAVVQTGNFIRRSDQMVTDDNVIAFDFKIGGNVKQITTRPIPEECLGPVQKQLSTMSELYSDPLEVLKADVTSKQNELSGIGVDAKFLAFASRFDNLRDSMHVYDTNSVLVQTNNIRVHEKEYKARVADAKRIASILSDNSSLLSNTVCRQLLGVFEKGETKVSNACKVLKGEYQKMVTEITHRNVLNEAKFVQTILSGQRLNHKDLFPDADRAIMDIRREPAENSSTPSQNQTEKTFAGQTFQDANATERQQKNAWDASNGYASTWMPSWLDAAINFIIPYNSIGDMGRRFRLIRMMGKSEKGSTHTMVQDLENWVNKPTDATFPKFMNDCTAYYVRNDGKVLNRERSDIPSLNDLADSKVVDVKKAVDIFSQKHNEVTPILTDVSSFSELTDAEAEIVAATLIERNSCSVLLNILKNVKATASADDPYAEKNLQESKDTFERSNAALSLTLFAGDCGLGIIKWYLNVGAFLRVTSNALDLCIDACEIQGFAFCGNGLKEHAKEQKNKYATSTSDQTSSRTSSNRPLLFNGVKIDKGYGEAAVNRADTRGQRDATENKAIRFLKGLKNFVTKLLDVFDKSNVLMKTGVVKLTSLFRTLRDSLRQASSDSPDVANKKIGVFSELMKSMGEAFLAAMQSLARVPERNSAIASIGAVAISVVVGAVVVGLVYSGLGDYGTPVVTAVIPDITNINATTAAVLADTDWFFSKLVLIKNFGQAAVQTTVEGAQSAGNYIASFGIVVAKALAASFVGLLSVGGALSFYALAPRFFYPVVVCVACVATCFYIVPFSALAAFFIYHGKRIVWNYVTTRLITFTIRFFCSAIIDYTLDYYIAKAKAASKPEHTKLAKDNARKNIFLYKLIKLLLNIGAAYFAQTFAMGGIYIVASMFPETVSALTSTGNNTAGDTAKKDFEKFTGIFAGAANGTRTSYYNLATGTEPGYGLHTINEYNWETLAGTYDEQTINGVSEKFISSVETLRSLYNLISTASKK